MKRKTNQSVCNKKQDGLDSRVTELVAIGASVAGHCQPCLAYHVAKARELGIDDAHIRAAIDVGHMVEKGAMSAMRRFSESAISGSPTDTSDCCSGASAKGDGKCCG